MLPINMRPSAIVTDPVFLKHEPGPYHPENPQRIKTLLDLAGEVAGGGDRFELLPLRSAVQAELELGHGSDYIDLVRSTSEHDRFALDGDTITCRDSFGVALMAVGGFLQLLDAVAASDYGNGFAMARPPGHHALRNRGMGFCLFNTVAIGARYLQEKHGARRVAIMDWDVHHGNGSQDAFYDDPSVLFLSTHQYPYYPGTGAADEVGSGRGEGYTVNVPLPAGCGDAEYLAVFRDIIVPAIERYEPDWLLVSAGFDSHRDDPLAAMGVTERGFGVMANALLELARKHTGGKIAFLLEGGYDLAALRNSVATVLECMQSEEAASFEAGGERIATRIREVLQIRERYW
ncbi:MAG: histone deacetylase [Deltaproteobacteria bacterium]|nr:histone deacetylase [Deltaproteobacteria bacterium]